MMGGRRASGAPSRSRPGTPISAGRPGRADAYGSGGVAGRSVRVARARGHAAGGAARTVVDARKRRRAGRHRGSAVGRGRDRAGRARRGGLGRLPGRQAVLVHALAIDRAAEAPGWLLQLSQWSMVDVVLVVPAIFAAGTSGLAVAGTMPGPWFYAGSAALALGAHALGRRDRAHAAWGRAKARGRSPTAGAPPEDRRGA